MREIIFRGLKEDNEGWVEGFYNFIEPDYLIYHYDESEKRFVLTPILPKTIGQFTGSYDANGNKIFEHDIIKKVVNDEELIGVVEYADAAFGVRFADGEGQFLCFFENCCEIIGNIHDNPELIKM